MLTRSLELAKYTMYTRQWGEAIHRPMEVSETKGVGEILPLPSCAYSGPQPICFLRQSSVSWDLDVRLLPLSLR